MPVDPLDILNGSAPAAGAAPDHDPLDILNPPAPKATEDEAPAAAPRRPGLASYDRYAEAFPGITLAEAEPRPIRPQAEPAPEDQSYWLGLWNSGRQAAERLDATTQAAMGIAVGSTVNRRRVAEKNLQEMQALDEAQAAGRRYEPLPHMPDYHQLPRAERERLHAEQRRLIADPEQTTGERIIGRSYALHENARRDAAERFPVSRSNAETFGAEAVTAIAELPKYVATAMAAGPLAMGTLMLGEGYGQKYMDAKQRGATDQEAHRVAMLNAGVQTASEGAAIGHSVSMITKALAPAMRGQFMAAVRAWAHSVGENSLSEALAQLGENAIDRGSTQPDKPLTDRVGRAAAVGAAVGHSMGSASMAAQGAASLRPAPILPGAARTAAGIEQELTDAQGQPPAPPAPPGPTPPGPTPPPGPPPGPTPPAGPAPTSSTAPPATAEAAAQAGQAQAQNMAAAAAGSGPQVSEGQWLDMQGAPGAEPPATPPGVNPPGANPPAGPFPNADAPIDFRHALELVRTLAPGTSPTAAVAQAVRAVTGKTASWTSLTPAEQAQVLIHIQRANPEDGGASPPAGPAIPTSAAPPSNAPSAPATSSSAEPGGQGQPTPHIRAADFVRDASSTGSRLGDTRADVTDAILQQVRKEGVAHVEMPDGTVRSITGRANRDWVDAQGNPVPTTEIMPADWMPASLAESTPPVEESTPSPGKGPETAPAGTARPDFSAIFDEEADKVDAEARAKAAQQPVDNSNSGPSEAPKPRVPRETPPEPFGPPIPADRGTPETWRAVKIHADSVAQTFRQKAAELEAAGADPKQIDRAHRLADEAEGRVILADRALAELEEGRRPPYRLRYDNPADNRRASRRPPRPPQSLLGYLRERGGMREDQGELRARGLDRLPGLINNRTTTTRNAGQRAGLTVEQAVQAAAEAGYLTPTREGRQDEDRLLDMLAEEASGRPQYVPGEGADHDADMQAHEIEQEAVRDIARDLGLTMRQAGAITRGQLIDMLAERRSLEQLYSDAEDAAADAMAALAEAEERARAEMAEMGEAWEPDADRLYDPGRPLTQEEADDDGYGDHARAGAEQDQEDRADSPGGGRGAGQSEGRGEREGPIQGGDPESGRGPDPLSGGAAEAGSRANDQPEVERDLLGNPIAAPKPKAAKEDDRQPDLGAGFGPSSEQAIKAKEADQRGLRGDAPQKGVEDFALFDPGARDQQPLELDPEAEFKTRLAAVKRAVRIFASGMSRPNDLDAGAAAFAGFERRGIGVEIGELSGEGLNALADAVGMERTPAFVDTGAFNLFRAGLRGREVKPLDFDAILRRFRELQDAIEERRQLYSEVHTDHPPAPLLVMPDIVGDQGASLALVQQHRGAILFQIQSSATGRPIIPIQKGEKSLLGAWRAVADTLGTKAFVVGIPGNAAAATPTEVEAFIREAKPYGVHFLGAGSPSRLDPFLAAVARAGVDLQHISADANILRGALYGHDTTEGRREAIIRVLRERGGEEAPEAKAPEPKPAEAQGAKDAVSWPIVEHQTHKGKTIRGTIWRGVTKDQAKTIDAFTFQKDGGWFIREKHLAELEKATASQAKPAEPKPAAGMTEADVSAAVDAIEARQAKRKRSDPSQSYAAMVAGWANDTGRKLSDEDEGKILAAMAARWQAPKPEAKPASGRSWDRPSAIAAAKGPDGWSDADLNAAKEWLLANTSPGDTQAQGAFSDLGAELHRRATGEGKKPEDGPLPLGSDKRAKAKAELDALRKRIENTAAEINSPISKIIDRAEEIAQSREPGRGSSFGRGSSTWTKRQEEWFQEAVRELAQPQLASLRAAFSRFDRLMQEQAQQAARLGLNEPWGVDNWHTRNITVARRLVEEETPESKTEAGKAAARREAENRAFRAWAPNGELDIAAAGFRRAFQLGARGEPKPTISTRDGLKDREQAGIDAGWKAGQEWKAEQEKPAGEAKPYAEPVFHITDKTFDGVPRPSEAANVKYGAAVYVTSAEGLKEWGTGSLGGMNEAGKRTIEMRLSKGVLLPGDTAAAQSVLDAAGLELPKLPGFRQAISPAEALQYYLARDDANRKALVDAMGRKGYAGVGYRSTHGFEIAVVDPAALALAETPAEARPDFGAIFDEEADKVDAAASKPTKAKLIPTRDDAGNVRYVPKPVAPEAPAADTRSTGQVAKDAAKKAGSGVAKAAKAIEDIFIAKGGKLHSNPFFDPDTYTQLKPAFLAAAQDFRESWGDTRILINRIYAGIVATVSDANRAAIRDAMKPYIVRFAEDVYDGKLRLEDGANADGEGSGRDQGGSPPASQQPGDDPQPGNAPAHPGNVEAKPPGNVGTPGGAGANGRPGIRGPAEDVGGKGAADEGGDAADGREGGSGAGASDAGRGKRALNPRTIENITGYLIENLDDAEKAFKAGTPDRIHYAAAQLTMAKRNYDALVDDGGAPAATLLEPYRKRMEALHDKIVEKLAADPTIRAEKPKSDYWPEGKWTGIKPPKKPKRTAEQRAEDAAFEKAEPEEWSLPVAARDIWNAGKAAALAGEPRLEPGNDGRYTKPARVHPLYTAAYGHRSETAMTMDDHAAELFNAGWDFARPTTAEDTIDAVDEQPPAQPGAADFYIDNPLEIVGGGQVARFKKNQDAITLYNELRDAGRPATPEEQRVLAGFTGWGSFGQELFQGTWRSPAPKAGWEARDQWLREHLGQAAWESAQNSIINAHYTDPPTVMAMWDMVKRLGFQGGRVLEPSMGIGNFFGMMPRDLAARSQLAGIELDKTTGGMAKLLYPRANIRIMPYQDSRTPDNFYDLVIGNWPFANVTIADRRYNDLSPQLHDYFFLKALDQVRPGGLVVGITSSGTMDKRNPRVRAAMARKAELLATIRLPTGAFADYAGTNVITDIIVLRKRPEPLPVTPQGNGWTQSFPFTPEGGQEVHVNQFYLANPGNVLGTFGWGHGTTTRGPGLLVHRPDDMADRLKAAVSLVPEGAYSADPRPQVSYITNLTDDRQGSLTVQDGKLYVVRGEHLAPAHEVAKYAVADAKETARRESQLRSLIDMRRSYAALLEAERTGEDAEGKRTALRRQYEAYTKAHGKLGDSYGLTYLERIEDPFHPALAALETDGRPAAILSRSTMRGKPKMANPTPADAYILARNSAVSPTLADVAKLAGKPAAEVKAALIESGAVFETPTGDIVPSDLYLSGNVREKLRQAKAAVEAEGMAHLQRNVDALQAVQPPDVPYYSIETQLGATWIPPSLYVDYVKHMLNMGPSDQRLVHVAFINGRWKARIDATLNHKPEAKSGFGTDHYPFWRLLNAALSNQTVKVTAEDADGRKYILEKETEEANARIAKMREDFGEWLWSEPTRRAQMEREYNETRNAYADPKFDGSFLGFEGMALDIGRGPFSLRKHQIDAIWRAIVNRRSINAHEVGTGKTFTMGGIAVESRRYGIAKKPLILAHNANSRAVATEIQAMYPAAKILYIDNLAPSVIALRLRQIANDDWDAVVMPHSLVDRMTMREETLMAMAADQIAAFEEEAIAEALEAGVHLTKDMMDDPEAMKRVRAPTAKDLVKARNRIIETIKKQAQRASKEGAVTFEELGIDQVLIDEVHAFKKPPIVTGMRMKGLQTDTSDRSIALMFLTQYVRSNNGGGNVHTFSGTPITNTLTEIYHMMRYVMLEDMRDAGLDQWDAWFSSFAKEEQDVELSAAGEYETINRLQDFINAPELRRMIGQFMDVVFSDDMPEMTPRTTASGKTMQSPDLTDAERAELLNGRTEGAVGRPYKQIVNVTSDMTPQQMGIFEHLQRLAAQFRDMSPNDRRLAMAQGHPSIPILVEQNAAKASFDVRLYGEGAERNAGQEGKVKDEPGSKLAKVIENVQTIYKSHPLAGQVIFVDKGTGETATRSMGRTADGDKITRKLRIFSPVKDLVLRLEAAGIPRKQIAVVDGKTSDEAKYEIAQAMNRGDIRVVIGSTGALGVGVNMQRNLRAMHHIDAPYMPGDLEQRNGRGLRQGNQWNTVLEYRYITDRLDGRRWQLLAIKQRFITKFLKGDPTMRVIEGDANDESGGDILSTFAEAAGDPRILMRAKLKKKLEGLRRRERVHGQAVVDAIEQVRSLEGRIADRKRTAKRTAAIRAAAGDLVERTKGDGFSATIDGKDYTKRADAAEAIKAFIATHMRIGTEAQPMGTFGGEQLLALWPSFREQPEVALQFADTRVQSTSLQGIEQQLRYAREWGENDEAEIAELVAGQARAREVAAQPFPRAADLEKVKQRLERLEADIVANPVPPPAWLRVGAPVDSLAYHHGDEFVVTGHRWSMAGWFVQAEDADGETLIPYTEVTDAQGLPLYELREFQPPVVVEKKGAAQPAAKAAPPAAPPAQRSNRLGATAPQAATGTTEARGRLLGLAVAWAKQLGLKGELAVELVNRIEGGTVDGEYTDGLVRFAMDNDPRSAAFRLWHEFVHAIMDPKVSPLSEAQRQVLLDAARRWMNQPFDASKLRPGQAVPADKAKGLKTNRAFLALLNPGKDADYLLMEAVAHLGERYLAKAIMPTSPTGRAMARAMEWRQGIGNLLRGAGFQSADAVLRGTLQGDRGTAEARRELDRLTAGYGEASVPLSGLGANAGEPPEPAKKAATPPAAATPAAAKAQQSAKSAAAPAPTFTADTTGLEAMGGAMAKGIGDSLRDALWTQLEAGSTKLGGHTDNLLIAAKMVRARGGLTDRAAFDRFAADWGTMTAGIGRDAARDNPERYRAAAMQVVDGHSPRPAATASTKVTVGGKTTEVSGTPAAVNDALVEAFGPEGAKVAPPTTEIAAQLAELTKSPERYFSRRLGPVTLANIASGTKTVIEKAKAALDRWVWNGLIARSVAPISVGTQRAQHFAFAFAGAQEAVRWRFGEVDRMLAREFTPEQRKKMWEAMDEQSVFEQVLARDLLGMPSAARAAHAAAARAQWQTDGGGWHGLTPKELEVVRQLDQAGQETWQRMQARGLVAPNARGLPSYMPRMLVKAAADGGAERVGDGKGGLAVGQIGANLTTRGPHFRKHLKADETEAAARAKLGDEVSIVRDVRVLTIALAQNERAIAGRDLVDAIKRIGESVGRSLVHQGELPVGEKQGWWHVEHYSLKRKVPRRKMVKRTAPPTQGALPVTEPEAEAGTWVIQKDEHGRTIMDTEPLWIAEEFKGPLLAVLSSPPNEFYDALMQIKGKSMSVIMFSPAMHNAVEYGRALPLDLKRMTKPAFSKPGKDSAGRSNMTVPLQMYAEGLEAQKSVPFMEEAIRAGLRPIGRSWFGDLTGVANDAMGQAGEGKSITAKAAGLFARPFGKPASDAAKRGVDKAGQVWHEKLLWDRVRDLQVGIYKSQLERQMAKGFPRDVAATMAAHLANRYAGALPPENLRRGLHMLANIGMFSRSFTLGNLGVIKDVLNGMPRHVRARIETLSDPHVAKRAQNAMRVKAFNAMLLDVGLFYITLSLAQSLLALAFTDDDMDDIIAGYKRRAEDYIHAISWDAPWNALALHHLAPMHDNEPGKQDRVLAGTMSDGTGEYVRLPWGKIAEEFIGWGLHPIEMAKRKLSPFVKPIMELLANKDGRGRDILPPRVEGIPAMAEATGMVAWHIFKAMFPADAIEDAYKAVAGGTADDRSMSRLKTVGSILGFSFSRGAPGGPEQGVIGADLRDRDYRVQKAIPEARLAYRAGRHEEAMRLLREAGLHGRDLMIRYRAIAQPARGERNRQRSWSQGATEEQRQRRATVNGGNRADGYANGGLVAGYADGGIAAGAAPAGFYETPVPDSREAGYWRWLDTVARRRGQSVEQLLGDRRDYDLQGAYLSGLQPDARGHLADTYKKPNHSTFSDGSVYSTEAAPGGHWQDLGAGQWAYEPSNTVRQHHTPEATREYFRQNEPQSRLLEQPGYALGGIADAAQSAGFPPSPAAAPVTDQQSHPTILGASQALAMWQATATNPGLVRAK